MGGKIWLPGTLIGMAYFLWRRHTIVSGHKNLVLGVTQQQRGFMIKLGLEKKLWKLSIPGKVKIFAWRALHGCVPCHMILVNKHIMNAVNCPVCQTKAKAIKHILFNFLVAEQGRSGIRWGFGIILRVCWWLIDWVQCSFRRLLGMEAKKGSSSLARLSLFSLDASIFGGKGDS